MGSKTLSGRWIWLTGASSGIGETLARRLIEAGNKVILTARNVDKLESLRELAPQSTWTLPADIGQRESADALRQGLREITDHLDTVILNAGNCEYVGVDQFDVELVERVAEVNYLGFARCVHAALPRLYASGNRPQLVGISSASVFFGLPRAEAYGASKAAVSYFLDSLRVDLYRRGVEVCTVHPGFVDTPLTRRNDFPMPWIMDTEQAADRILSGIAARKAEISFPLPLIASLKLMAALPATWGTRMAQKMAR